MIAGSQQSYRLKVRVGDSEFDADGPEDTVKAQFDLFLMALKYNPSQDGKTGGKKEESHSPGTAAAAKAKGSIEQNTWDRFFNQEGDEHVSLKVLPSTPNRNADAILLLLYGFLHLCNKDTVPSIDLLLMAKKSGLRVDRIDRNIPAEHARYVNRGGSRKGCRYSLNNQGQIYVQSLLEAEAER